VWAEAEEVVRGIEESSCEVKLTRHTLSLQRRTQELSRHGSLDYDASLAGARCAAYSNIAGS